MSWVAYLNFLWSGKLFVLIEISTLIALWLCYQLIIHACSDTDLRKFDLCKFFSVFLVFQCGASGRSPLTSGRVSGPDSTLLESGRVWSPIVRTGPDWVRTHAATTGRTVSKTVQTRVRTTLMLRLDGDPTVAINSPARCILSIYPTQSHFWLFVSFPSCEFLAFLHIPLIFQVFFSSFSLQFVLNC
jgi:hypothetical protein